MQLLSSPNSPFARKCRVLILEAGIADVDIRDVAASPLGGEPAIAAANPSGKIPALLRDDAPAIHDSRVITRFLDDRAGAGLYPSGARLWDVLTLEATADAIGDAAVGMAYEMRLRPAERQWPDWIEAQWAKVARSLDALEARALPLLAGPASMAQVAVGCALGYLDLRHAARDWRAGRAGLAEWEAAYAARPAMAATVPPG